MMDDFLIFLVEDDPWYREILRHKLSIIPHVRVKEFTNAKDLFLSLDTNPNLITLDYSLPDMGGVEVLKKITEHHPDLPVVVISAQEDINTAIKLLKVGAYDYLSKDDKTYDRITNIIKNLREKEVLKKEIFKLKGEVSRKYDFKSNIIGSSPVMKRVFLLMEKAIGSSITVSITGETGTGKEVVAKSIHYSSPRAKFPFVAVNIAAIPSELIESELFGHEKGAFTGAVSRRIGKFEEASGGTIFLDEIGEMDVNMQSKLLRVLQEKELSRVGGNSIVKLGCRVVVATHRDLADEVIKGNFREDLYYRLLGLPISLPPLRDRGQDILLLAKHFATIYAQENETEKVTFTPEAQTKLLNYPWPGNIRELKAIVELSSVMTDTNVIGAEHISFTPSRSMDTLLQNEMPLREYTNKIIHFFLSKYDNDVVTVAKKLNIGKSTIYRMLQEHS